MKLSEMNTRQLAAALCRLTPPTSRIAEDEALSGVFKRLKDAMIANEYMTSMQKMAMLMDAVPVLLEAHYADTVEIIAAMTGKSTAEVDEQNGMETIKELAGCIDSQFIDFFRSSAAMDQTGTDRGE